MFEKLKSKLKPKSVDFLNGKLWKGLIKFAIPLIFSGILQLLFNAADLVVVGQFGSETAVAAVGATGMLVSLMVNFFLGFSTGAGVVVAFQLGAKNASKVEKAVHTAIFVSIIVGIFLTIVGVFFSGTFLTWMGTPDDIFAQSKLYLQIYFGGALFSIVYNFGASILRSAGDTSSPLIYLVISGVVNVILNLFFVIVLQMDVAGVASATLISQAISACLVLMNLVRRKDQCKFVLSKLRIDIESLKEIIRVGLPAGIQSAMFNIANVLMQSSVNTFETAAIAGCAAANNIENFVYITMNAFYHTTINYVSQNYGGRRFRRVTRSVLYDLMFVSIAGIVTGSLVVLFAEPLLSIYVPKMPEAIPFGRDCLMVSCLPYFLCGIMDVLSGALRGIGRSTTTMIATIFSVCVFRLFWIFTIFPMPEMNSVMGLYLCWPLSWLISLSANGILFFITWRHIKKTMPSNDYSGL